MKEITQTRRNSPPNHIKHDEAILWARLNAVINWPVMTLKSTIRNASDFRRRRRKPVRPPPPRAEAFPVDERGSRSEMENLGVDVKACGNEMGNCSFTREGGLRMIGIHIRIRLQPSSNIHPTNA